MPPSPNALTSIRRAGAEVDEQLEAEGPYVEHRWFAEHSRIQRLTAANDAVDVTGSGRFRAPDAK